MQSTSAGTEAPTAVLPDQGAGWKHLQRILAAQHIDDLGAFTPEQIQDMQFACFLLIDDKNGTLGTRPWSSEQRDHLELLLHAVTHALSLYMAYQPVRELSCRDNGLQGTGVLSQLLMMVTDVLECTFQLDYPTYLHDESTASA
jgi:hypothetical protein